MEIDMSFASLILAIIAIILIFVFRRVDSERIVDNSIIKFKSQTEPLIQEFRNLVNEAKNVTTPQSSDFRPDIGSYSTQWRFLEKVFHNRYEKHSICRKIVKKYISDKDVILLDSGSTVDLVTYELLNFPEGQSVCIYSNNVFASLHLVETNMITFHLLSGTLSERFAAVYSKESTIEVEEKYSFTVIILAAVAIRVKKGIMVNSDDDGNKLFKHAALSSFKKSRIGDCKLLIAVDSTKMITPLSDSEGNDTMQTVMDESEWEELLKTRKEDIILVTSPIPDSDTISPEQEVLIKREIESFKSKGIYIDES